MRALVIGGASCAWDDLRALGSWGDVRIAVNDMASVYPHRIDHIATLHAEKLIRWTAERERRGGNMDFVTWGRPEKPGTDRTLAGWTSGSSGLFAVGVALELGAEQVVLAGVPMDPQPHFFNEAEWPEFRLYRKAWERRADALRGRVFSMSGWTRELLGSPPWLQREEAA